MSKTGISGMVVCTCAPPGGFRGEVSSLGRSHYIAVSLLLIAQMAFLAESARALSYDDIVLLTQAEQKALGHADNSHSFDERIKALEISTLGGPGSGSESKRIRAICRKLGMLPAEPEPAPIPVEAKKPDPKKKEPKKPETQTTEEKKAAKVEIKPPVKQAVESKPSLDSLVDFAELKSQKPIKATAPAKPVATSSSVPIKSNTAAKPKPALTRKPVQANKSAESNQSEPAVSDQGNKTGQANLQQQSILGLFIAFVLFLVAVCIGIGVYLFTKASSSDKEELGFEKDPDLASSSAYPHRRRGSEERPELLRSHISPPNRDAAANQSEAIAQNVSNQNWERSDSPSSAENSKGQESRNSSGNHSAARAVPVEDDWTNITPNYSAGSNPRIAPFPAEDWGAGNGDFESNPVNSASGSLDSKVISKQPSAPPPPPPPPPPPLPKPAVQVSNSQLGTSPAPEPMPLAASAIGNAAAKQTASQNKPLNASPKPPNTTPATPPAPPSTGPATLPAPAAPPNNAPAARPAPSPSASPTTPLPNNAPPAPPNGQNNAPSSLGIAAKVQAPESSTAVPNAISNATAPRVAAPAQSPQQTGSTPMGSNGAGSNGPGLNSASPAVAPHATPGMAMGTSAAKPAPDPVVIAVAMRGLQSPSKIAPMPGSLAAANATEAGRAAQPPQAKTHFQEAVQAAQAKSTASAPVHAAGSALAPAQAPMPAPAQAAMHGPAQAPMPAPAKAPMHAPAQAPMPAPAQAPMPASAHAPLTNPAAPTNAPNIAAPPSAPPGLPIHHQASTVQATVPQSAQPQSSQTPKAAEQQAVPQAAIPHSETPPTAPKMGFETQTLALLSRELEQSLQVTQDVATMRAVHQEQDPQTQTAILPQEQVSDSQVQTMILPQHQAQDPQAQTMTLPQNQTGSQNQSHAQLSEIQEDAILGELLSKEIEGIAGKTAAAYEPASDGEQSNILRSHVSNTDNFPKAAVIPSSLHSYMREKPPLRPARQPSVPPKDLPDDSKEDLSKMVGELPEVNPAIRTVQDFLQKSTKPLQFKSCPECDASYSLDAKFCINDGMELEAAEDSTVAFAFGERYEIESVIASGGMSVLYHARHKMLNRDVAIKVMDPRLVRNSSAVKRFQREAQMICRMNHPNVIVVHDFGTTNNGQPYIVMDFLAGKTLCEILDKETQLAWSRAKTIFLQVASGLGHAHQLGVIHRDVKPTNIIVDKNEFGGDQVTIVDFGIAKMGDEVKNPRDKLTQFGELFGTTMYMSPEQCRGIEVDLRTDIYSLGCVMFEVLSGLPPFNTGDDFEMRQMIVSGTAPLLSVRRPDITLPPLVESILQKALEKDPDKRYQTMDELMFDLARVV